MGRRLALRRSVGVLGLVHAARTPVAGDFTAHHRGARPNPAGDTHLGQASLQPHHNRRAILNTYHPTIAHNQPLQQHCYHTNCLHPMTLPFLTGGVGLFWLARESGLNAPFGARCFLTCFGRFQRSPLKPSLNAPYGARCFLTRRPSVVGIHLIQSVLMHLMTLGAF